MPDDIRCPLITIQSVRNTSENDDWCVTHALVREGPDELLNRGITVVGNLPDADVGICYDARLKYTSHPRFGEQYRVLAALKTIPKDHRNLTRYLASVMPGIGPARAGYIVDAFGENTVAILDSEEAGDRLINEVNIPTDVANEAMIGWRKDRDNRHARMVLIDAGVSMRMAAAITTYFGNLNIEIADIITTAPYRLMEVPRVGFRLADQVALNSGMRGDDPQRLYAGAAHVAEEKTREGHCYTLFPDLVAETSELLGQPAHTIINALMQPTTSALLIVDNEHRCWPVSMLQAETDLARGLYRLRSVPSPLHRQRGRQGQKPEKEIETVPDDGLEILYQDW